MPKNKLPDIEEFFEEFEPVNFSPEEEYETYMLETYGEDLKMVLAADPKYVWTLVEGDSGALWLIAGYHVVNRLNYVISRKPWDTSEEIFPWEEVSAENNKKPETK